MKKFFYLMTCLSIVGLFGACNDDKDKNGDGDLTFKFPLTTYDAPKVGGVKVIGFATPDKWTAKVKYTDDVVGAPQWLTVSPTEGTAGHWFLSLDLHENIGNNDRNAEVIITCNGVEKVLKVSQVATGALILPETNYSTGEKGGIVEVAIQTNRNFEITFDSESEEWMHIVDAKSAVMKDTIARILVDPNPTMDSRTGYAYITEVNEDPKAEVISRRVEITQRGDLGYFIMKGAATDLTAPSAVMNEDGTFDAIYLYKTKNIAATDVTLHSTANGDPHSPHDLSSDGTLGVRFTASSAFTNMGAFGPTWDQANGDGELTFFLYVWDTDYAVTVAAEPLHKNPNVRYTNSTWAVLMDKAQQMTFPAGEYLLVLQSTKKQSGIWCSTNPVPEGSESFLNGNKITSKCAKTKLTYVVDASSGAAFRHSKDGGKSWTGQKYVYHLNNSWMKSCNPTDLRVSKCGATYYALIADAGKIKIAKTTDIERAWGVWQTGAWSTTTFTYASIWDNAKPVSVIEHGGKMFVYALDGAKLLVKSAASGVTWPASLSGSTTAYTFPGATDASVSYDVNQNVFVATYVKENQTYSLESTDGLTFTDAGLSISRMFDGAASPRYVTGVTPGTEYLSYTCDQGWYFKVMTKE